MGGRMSELGFNEGDKCNRDGCQGEICQSEPDGCCSCHINPPCSYCTTPREICNECDWSAKDEENTYQAEGRIILWPDGGVVETKKVVLDPAKIDYVSRMHSSSSMIKEGVYPPGATEKEVEAEVVGTFGGRFERFGGGKFKYIAYTD